MRRLDGNEYHDLRVFDCCVRGNNTEVAVFEFLVVFHDESKQGEGCAGKRSVNQNELDILQSRLPHLIQRP